jgi:Flp pilus assembly protein CpaB
VAARFSAGHVVMLLAGALGVLLTLSALHTAAHADAVVVAAHDLVPGTTLQSGDLRIAQIRADRSVLAETFRRAALPALRGEVITALVPEGALLTRGSVQNARSNAAARVMSFALPRAHAVDGHLAGGDRVDIVAVDHDSARASYVMTNVEVVAVDSSGGGPLSGSSDEVTLSVAVAAEEAPRLAAALEAKVVSLIRATGAAPAEPVGGP